MSEDTMAGNHFTYIIVRFLAVGKTFASFSLLKYNSLITWDEIGQIGDKSVTGKVSIIKCCQLP